MIILIVSKLHQCVISEFLCFSIVTNTFDMSWRVGDPEPGDDFYAALYDEDEEYGDWSDEDEQDSEDSPMEPAREPELPEELPRPSSPSSPLAPPYSPLTSPTRRRSRSPLRRELQARIDEQGNMYYELGQGEGEFELIPDVQAVFESMNDDGMIGEREGNMNMLVDESGERLGVRVRGRQAGRSGLRGRGQGRARRGRGGRSGRGGGRGALRARSSQWRVGDPLQVVWVDDDDVPAELRNMVMDVVRRREGRVHERESEEVINVEDRGDNLLAGENLNFEWSSNMETFQKQEVPFTPERTGAVGEYSSPYSAFRSYWDDEIVSVIVTQTNLYASKIRSATFQQNWYSTNAHEILCLFAFWMMLGIIRMPTIKSCFSENPLLKVHIFKKMFTQQRYEHLMRALHFVEADPAMTSTASTSMADTAADRMHRLRPIIDHLNAKFQANYIPSQDISIDESLTLWKGWLNIKQYIRNKAAKFGIKTYELCEAATGYLWSFVVYTAGHSNPDLPNDPSTLKSTAVVRKLMTPLLSKGYRLFMDNWYNSPMLARWLKAHGTDCVGTLRPTRSDVPPLINLAQLKQGQLMARHSGDVCIVAWQDKKKVVTISTCHGAEIGLSKVLSASPSRPLPFKPQVVLDYNKSMGGVDLKDQMLEPYLLERKRCKKWYMKLFKRLLNCSILNARILLASSTQTPQNHLVFRLNLVDKILQNHFHHLPSSRREARHFRNADPTRMTTNTHWPVHIPQTDPDASRGRQSRQKCYVCLKEGRKTQRSAYKCEVCNVPLCITDCFKRYHTTHSM